MTMPQFAFAACRVLGLYFIANATISALSSLPVMLGFFPAPSGIRAWAIVAAFIPWVVQFLAGTLIWMRAAVLAEKICRG